MNIHKKNRPVVSVVIPLKKLSSYIIADGLPAFSNQAYKNFEVILLPDKKAAGDQVLIREYPFVRIIATDHITRPALKRDIGVKNAKGQIIAFIDDDAYPEKNWLKNSVSLFKKNYAAVCGPGIVPKQGQFWEHVFQTVLESPLGSANYTYRFRPDKRRLVDDYPSMNFLIQKEIFLKLGGFNSQYWPGEDSKLCEDIVYKLKAKILYDPSVLVFHHRRPSLGHFLRQHGQYGFHRGAFFAHGDRNSRRISYLVPTAFVTYLLLLALQLFWQPILTNFNRPSGSEGRFQSLTIIPLITYKLILLYHFLTTFLKSRSLQIALLSSIVIFLMHVYYGIRFVHGFFVGLIKKDAIYGSSQRADNNS